MKDFFKFTLASMLGFFLTIILFIILSIILITAIISASSQDNVSINNNSILKLQFDKSISERTPNMPENFFDLESFKIEPGLNDILKDIKKAQTDERIEGIFLELGEIPSDLTILSEVRLALSEFKTSGKFIYAYADNYSQKGYYLASVADKVFLNPEGQLLLKGLAAQPIFFKGTLEKLGVEAQIIRHGKYKSAIEPFILDEMSEASREQMEAYVGSVWDEMISSISESRGMDTDELNKIADELKAENPVKAVQLGLVDSLLYMDEMNGLLSKEIGVDYLKKSNLLTLYNYNKDNSGMRAYSQNKIAVIFANGSIYSGEGKDNNIYGKNLSRTLRQVRLDDKIKAVVFRINSPGGDALASDVILREVKLLSEQKPIVVSMGNYAASGGYYISCGADYIFANEMTLTGSIGVFGMIPNIQELLNKKLGITIDEVKTNENADYIGITKPMSDYQKTILTQQIERIYQVFITHVSEGRSLTIEEVDAIGQGRIWSGSDALEIGLIDEIGGLNNAIEKAVDLAGLEEFRIVELPEQLEPIEEIIRDLSGETSASVLKSELGEFYLYIEAINEIREMKGVQAKIPFVMIVE